MVNNQQVRFHINHNFIINMLRSFRISFNYLWCVCSINSLYQYDQTLIHEQINLHYYFFRRILTITIMENYSFDWRNISLFAGQSTCWDGIRNRICCFSQSKFKSMQFFPLAIQNIAAFYSRQKTILSDPVGAFFQIFKNFNLNTLIYTIISIIVLFILRNKLSRFPSILILTLLGIAVNIYHTFKTYSDLCSWENIDCLFHFFKFTNTVIPKMEEILYLLPISFILTGILIFQQFLYIQQFQRRGRKYKDGDLGDIQRETKVMCISNILCGLLGGFPVCINLFATYQNFSFTKKYGFRGTKVVGVSQIFFNYLLYGILKPGYDLIPLFVIFCIIITPMIYFFKQVYKFYTKQLKLIICLGLLNVITHPIFALVIAAFYSIYQMAMLLRVAPAEIVIQSGNGEISIRQSTNFQNLQQICQEQYYAKIIAIEQDIAPIENENYIIYRFTGSVSYLNFHDHQKEIQTVIYRKIRGNPQKQIYSNIQFSFRYVQNIDDEALQDLAYLVKDIKEQNKKKCKVIITGLHSTLIQKFKKNDYFLKMLQEQDGCFYRMHGRDIKE